MNIQSEYMTMNIQSGSMNIQSDKMKSEAERYLYIVPLIIESVIESNAYGEDLQRDLRALGGEIAVGAPLKPLAAPSAEWEAALAPLLAAGETWFSAPWFLVENYLYKRMLELTDGPTDGADPFAAQTMSGVSWRSSAWSMTLRKSSCGSRL